MRSHPCSMTAGLAVSLAIWASLAAASCRRDEARGVVSGERAVELGRSLFFDTTLSGDGRVSCASCHRPERGYTDGLVRASGMSGRSGTRNTPGLLDVTRQRSLFWDGRRARLEDQALDPLLNEVEHGLSDDAQLLAKLRANPRTVAGFAATFSSGGASSSDAALVTAAHVAEALAAFERTLVSPPAPFDRFRAGDKEAMLPAARRGWVVFQQMRCTRCHLVDEGERPLFTDHEFHSLAIGLHKVARQLPRLTERMVALRHDGRPLGREVLLDAELAELGRFAVTLDPRDLAAFKTPGLRNVALTGPYMHDGSVATLGDAVDLEVYSRGARDTRPQILTPTERADLVAFLEALTSDPVTGRAR